MREYIVLIFLKSFVYVIKDKTFLISKQLLSAHLRKWQVIA